MTPRAEGNVLGTLWEESGGGCAHGIPEEPGPPGVRDRTAHSHQQLLGNKHLG